MEKGTILQRPIDFASAMKSSSRDTGYIVKSRTGMIGSNTLFDKLAKEIRLLEDFSDHEAIFFKYDDATKCLYVVFVHSTIRGQAQGGTRLSSYDDIEKLVFDGLRLSKGMTDKNSIAGLWWGGGKAIICPIDEEALLKITQQKKDNAGKPVFENEFAVYENLEHRKLVFTNYGRFVTSLLGVYVAAEDIGTDTNDMESIFSVCRHITCLPKSVGGSGNPSEWTAKGIRNSMRATVKFCEQKDDLSDKVINIQGVGNVGKCVAKEVLEYNAARINIYDWNEAKLNNVYEDLISRFPGKVFKVTEEEIFTLPCDIFSPCARGAILNSRTIPLLNCKYVIGAANNQLETKSDYQLFNKRLPRIIYLPDFYINRLGIISCANEQYGHLENVLEIEVAKIFDDPQNGTIRLLKECKESEEQNKAPQEVALELANKWIAPHPIWGYINGEPIPTGEHRGAKLIAEYVTNFKKAEEEKKRSC